MNKRNTSLFTGSSLVKVVLSLIFALGFLQAEPLLQEGNKNGYDVKLSTKKSLVVGSNSIYITVTKEGEVQKDIKVKLKFFMPEMPGMPYMEHEHKAKFNEGKFKINTNFSMGGTWQYQLKFKTSDGKVHKIRGSVNI